MNTQIESKLRRIERISIILRGICTALFVPVGIVTVVAAVAVAVGRFTSVNFFGLTITVADLSSGGRLLVAVVGLLTGAVIVKALFHLRHLAGNYSRQDIFTTDSALQMRQFGISCMLWGVMKLAWAFLPMLVLTNPPPAAGITIDSLVIGAVVVVLSWFTEMAATLREENDLTI